MQTTKNNQINWTVICVSEYARHKEMKPKEAFNYLHAFGGISFLVDCYEAEHTLSLEDAVEDLDRVCQRNGGTL